MTYLKGLYTELIQSNPKVNFFFGGCNIEILKKEFGEYENVRFIRLYSKNKYLRLTFIIPYIVIKYKIDISHFQYILPLFRFSKEILTLHDILFMDFPEFFPYGYRVINKILFRQSAKHADFKLTVSDYSKQKISEHFKIKMEQIHVIPNGVADDYFKYDIVLPDIRQKYDLDKYLLYVSRFEPRKNHVLLLRAFDELKLWKSGYKLVFIGSRALDTPLFDACLKALPDEARRSVLIIAKSYGNELKSFYRNCSLFVYPSLAEGFGIPPLEAVASKVPVLCSGSTAMSDFSFLGNGLFNPQDISELKEKIILKLNSDKNDLNSNAEFIKRKYNWKNSAALFSDLIINSK
jgi:glycosyltransferase involved in cell wall biosynthesis